jgi:hypothetical protein
MPRRVFAFAMMANLATDKRFIRFNALARIAKLAPRVDARHQLAQFVANPPSAFVGDASLPFDFFGRHAVPRAGHEIHRKEPNREFGAALVKNGPGARISVMTAFLAGVGPPLGHRMKPRPLSANRAVGFLTAVPDFHDSP